MGCLLKIDQTESSLYKLLHKNKKEISYSLQSTSLFLYSNTPSSPAWVGVLVDPLELFLCIKISFQRFKCLLQNFNHTIYTQNIWSSKLLIKLTPGDLVSGSQWLCTQNLYANFWPWPARHPNVNKWVSSPDLLNFSQFHRHIFKTPTMLTPYQITRCINLS